ncbi:2-dehydro-3-deoxygalactonokinase [Noviherbaspirillum galbum]|uniref:2-dehydro-3-deoxygalactonokinase n=1 Tax=Noviherbaspirillum galbum TaxID=2709383 RepID=A0A6B3SVI7_9BURK|nr:2-dehydro-3-deoxygalactonokinase [Noviherbaspirillum galbum]NEX62906.1 2-dehydro-3-deoxygalactonokinase [Noviherbaspirillum galbum]
MKASCIAVIDGGTTRTRVRVWDGRAIVWEASRIAGARDVALRGKDAVRQPLAGMLDDARRAHDCRDVVAYGMITSDNGLREVPHLAAPASFERLAGAIVADDIPGLGPVHFIPGVKTTVSEPQVEDIGSLDVMRGEETEVFGLRAALGLTGRADFFHVGSHHKLIRTDERGIIGSCTALTGELLAALQRDTILAASMAPLEQLDQLDPSGEPDGDAWNAGRIVAQRQGFSRAAFCVRLLDQLLAKPPAYASAFLLGAAASLDLPLLLSSTKLYLYGHRTITGPLCRYLRSERRMVDLVPPERIAPAATAGAAALLRARLELTAP